jgi:muramoyltetrapeptide carboxypeptidase
MLDETIDILWAYRGGYGAANLINDLVNNLKGKNISTKYLIGFSDITPLHFYFNQKLGLPSLHGSVLAHLLKKAEINDFSLLDNMAKIINGEITQVKYPVTILNKAFKKDNLEGISIGGNLTLINNAT